MISGIGWKLSSQEQLGVVEIVAVGKGQGAGKKEDFSDDMKSSHQEARISHGEEVKYIEWTLLFEEFWFNTIYTTHLFITHLFIK